MYCILPPVIFTAFVLLGKIAILYKQFKPGIKSVYHWWHGPTTQEITGEEISAMRRFTGVDGKAAEEYTKGKELVVKKFQIGSLSESYEKESADKPWTKTSIYSSKGKRVYGDIIQLIQRADTITLGKENGGRFQSDEVRLFTRQGLFYNGMVCDTLPPKTVNF